MGGDWGMVVFTLERMRMMLLALSVIVLIKTVCVIAAPALAAS
jgi:hypothetical protein